MTIDITVRFSITSDTDANSLFRVERSFDFDTWTDLGDQAPSTTTYAGTTLASQAAYGATSVVLTSATNVATSGYGWVDADALIQWTGKSTNTLTGVTWHSGYGTYAAGSGFAPATEYINDLAVTPTNGAVVYRITHIDADGNLSAPAYFWYYYPPTPASSQHCVVIVNIGPDIGITPRSGISVLGYMADDKQFATAAGQHLDANVVAANTQTTNALGLAFFQCWRSGRRSTVGDVTDAMYTFVLDSATAAKAVTVLAGPVPDRDWVLLKDIGTTE